VEVITTAVQDNTVEAVAAQPLHTLQVAALAVKVLPVALTNIIGQVVVAAAPVSLGRIIKADLELLAQSQVLV
jgi:hypothetical protein